MRIILGAALAAAAVLPVPARAQVAVSSPTLEEREAAPGDSYAGTVRVRNGGTSTERVRVYQADYQSFADGRAWFGAPGSHARSSAPWVSFSPSVLVLAPGEEATVRYEVRVPPGAAGTYWSVLMVEGEGAPGAPSRGVRLTPVMRYAVQLATHAGGAGSAELTFGTPRLAAGPSGHRLALEVANGGARAGRVELRLELFLPDGTPAGRFEARRGLLYPGSSLEQEFDLGRLAPGSYRAQILADADGDELFAAEYTLRL